VNELQAPLKVTINGKSYDFQAPAYNRAAPNYAYDEHHGRMRNRSRYGHRSGIMGDGKHGHYGCERR
jgi:hypothetical protein